MKMFKESRTRRRKCSKANGEKENAFDGIIKHKDKGDEWFNKNGYIKKKRMNNKEKGKDGYPGNGECVDCIKHVE